MKSKTKPISDSYPEGKGVALLSFVFLSLLSLMSYHSMDQVTNWLGILGHFYAWVLLYLFGLTIYPILAFMGWAGWNYLIKEKVVSLKMKLFHLGLFVFSLGMTLSLYSQLDGPVPGGLKDKIISESVRVNSPYPHLSTRYYLAGIPLYYLYHDLPIYNLERLLGRLGVGMTFSLTLIVSFLFLTNIQLSAFISKNIQSKKKEEEQIEPLLSKPSPKISTGPEKERASPSKPTTSKGGYKLPPPSLLSNAKKVDQPSLKKELKRQAEILEETLLSFGIEAKVGNINCGPVIASFEILPAVGVKVQKITTLENDIALKLQAKSIRIIAPIPGKAAVGVEIPSPYPQEVGFKEILLAYQQEASKLSIPLILGKTVTGDDVITDLTKMPHCLIAGATGSGKSVCINTMIMSILMTATPDEVKLIMIDPKKVELTPYTKLPHLIAPVITEPHGAYAALNWMVKEMQDRYEILKQLGLRNISAFNSRLIQRDFENSLPMTIPEKMPFIVCIIDEFADLMMASSSDLETPIARIAQMARAVGLHLVLATQRPSREVITGLIKANFPVRIAFKVASQMNSRIIFDQNGAEKLLGHGDLLFLPPATPHLIRAQGAYTSDQDIHSVLQFIAQEAPAQYTIPSFDSMVKEASSDEPLAKDALYEEAKAIVIETQSASTTYLQRKLKIGYARAASLMDELEMYGVISPQEGSKPRRVLIENNNQKTPR